MEINEIVKLLKSANTIALFSHINPDCDTLGSALALRRFLLKMGKTVSAYCDGERKFDLSDLPDAETIDRDPQKTSYDLTVAVDCATHDRMGRYVSLFDKGKKTICIDHHLQDRYYAQYNLVDTHAGATAELMFLLMKEYDLSVMDKEIASLLYTALVTDTGNFAFSNTTSRTLAIASELLTYGVDQATISFKHFREIPLDTFKLKARVLAKAQFFVEGQIGVLLFTRDDMAATGTTPANTSNLVNDVVNVQGVKVGVSITETKPYSYKVSIRTHGEVSANAIAETFGGGGHKNAAGFTLNGFSGNVLDDVIKACKDNL